MVFYCLGVQSCGNSLFVVVTAVDVPPPPTHTHQVVAVFAASREKVTVVAVVAGLMQYVITRFRVAVNCSCSS